MANIITMLEKEIEKGNLYADSKGNTIKSEKIETMAKRSYVNDLKSGAIGFDTSFDSYHADILAGYMSINAIIQIMKDAIGYTGSIELTDKMPEPIENDSEPENVAN